MIIELNIVPVIHSRGQRRTYRQSMLMPYKVDMNKLTNGKCSKCTKCYHWNHFPYHQISVSMIDRCKFVFINWVCRECDYIKKPLLNKMMKEITVLKKMKEV